MRPHEAFDPTHKRCRWPVFGKSFNIAMDLLDLDAKTVATGLGISPEIVRAYRRGFARPSSATMTKIETYFGRSFPTGEKPRDPESVDAKIVRDLNQRIKNVENQLSELIQMVRRELC